MVPAVLWGNIIIEKEATGESSFKLAFSAEVVLTVEVDLPSYWIKHQDLEKNDQALRRNLDFLPEIRLIVNLKLAAYKERISRAYNNKVLERPMDVSDLVLHKTAASGKAHNECKLTANWEGPYITAKKLAPDSFILRALMIRS